MSGVQPGWCSPGTAALWPSPPPAPRAQGHLTYPNGGEPLSGSLTAEWTASDADGDELFYHLLYSADDGLTWTPLVEYLTDQELSLDTSVLAIRRYVLPFDSLRIVLTVPSGASNSASLRRCAAGTVTLGR